MKTEVIIYSTTWCGFCKMAKNYMTQLGVAFTEKDVEQDPVAANEAVQKSGQMGVPVIDISGTIIVGFDKPTIDSALQSNNLV
ncbi:NrdH-redoxin [Candidatus Saccharibacteria bacterium]|nr:NrdH-redoxin [Candidatus Saccharibacteria bacterium]